MSCSNAQGLTDIHPMTEIVEQPASAALPLTPATLEKGEATARESRTHHLVPSLENSVFANSIDRRTFLKWTYHRLLVENLPTHGRSMALESNQLINRNDKLRNSLTRDVIRAWEQEKTEGMAENIMAKTAGTSTQDMQHRIGN